MFGRPVRGYAVLAATCCAWMGCNQDAVGAGANAAADSSSVTTATPVAFASTRWTEYEASALATLTRSGQQSVYRESAGPSAAGNAFIVSGVIQADGDITSDSLVNPTHDQRVCRPFRDIITPRQRDGVGNAIVWIAGITSGKPNDLPRRTSIRLNDCRLDPRVHVIAEGGTVLVGSRDAMVSRIRMTDVIGNAVPRTVVPLNDFGQVVPDADIARTAGLVEVTDDRHPWVRGYIAVSPHPYITVTGASGTFQFTGVPAGKHEVIVFSESLGIMRRMIDVRSDVLVELKYGR